MADAVTAWIEQGLLQVVHHLGQDRCGERAFDELVVILPPVTGLVRLWGSFDTSRAAGFCAALPHPLLRAATRAAATEFCGWPAPTVAGLLRRAEADALAEPWCSRAPVEVLTDVWDRVAVAWARQRPEELPLVHERLYGRRERLLASGLWQQAIAVEAGRRALLPPPEHRPAGTPKDWAKQSRWALTAAQRARACLALAAVAYEGEQAGP